MKIKIQIIALLLLSLLPACKKNSGSNVEQIDPTVKKYFSYKPGTYWIYRDSLTGEVDSFAITGNSYMTVSYTNGSANVEYDIIQIYNEGVRDTTVVRCRLESYGMTYYYGTEWYSNSIFFGLGYPFSGYSAMYQTYQLYGNTYNNVTRYTFIDTTTLTDIYVTTDAGIVKLKLIHPSNPIYRIWELQKYNIVH